MPDTVSLTKELKDLDGKFLKLLDEGKEERLTVRTAIKLALTQGSQFAQQKGELTEEEKLDAYMLARGVVNASGTGYSFTPEEITTLKKFAYLRWPTEFYGALLEVIDPVTFKKKEKSAAKPD